MQGKTKTTFINQSELEQRLNNQIKPTSFRLISGLEYTIWWRLFMIEMILDKAKSASGD